MGFQLANAAMKRRPLGKTNLLVSEIGVGAWQLGGPLLLDGKVDGHPELGREYCVRLIREAGDLGINFVDTAEQYGNGESERRVGEALEGHRDQWILGTKFGYQVGPHGERLQDASPARVPISLEGSLRRLRTDYIDIYVYHIAPKPGEAGQVASYLQKLKHEGKVRAVGISTNDLQQVEYLHSLGCLDVVQYAKNIMEPHRDLSEWVASHQAGGVVRGAFYGGRLSGRYFHQAPDFSPDDIRKRILKENASADFAKYAVFEELLTPERGMIQLALRYLLDDPGTTTIIPGGKSIADYQAAIRATELPPLTASEQSRISRLRDKLLARSVAG
jgi:aryl-alcohol dehydrogenase-like predicted oxidoreductase